MHIEYDHARIYLLNVLRPMRKALKILSIMKTIYLLPTGSEEREVLGFGSIPVGLLPSCQYVKNIAL